MNKSLPLFSVPVFAGFPSPAEEYLEKELDLNEHLIGNRHATYLVRVKGESMEGACIHDGDLLVVDRSLHVTDGRLVVATLEDGLVVKRFRKQKENAWLESAGRDGVPQKIAKVEGIVEVWGVVTYIIHKP